MRSSGFSADIRNGNDYIVVMEKTETIRIPIGQHNAAANNHIAGKDLAAKIQDLYQNCASMDSRGAGMNYRGCMQLLDSLDKSTGGYDGISLATKIFIAQFRSTATEDMNPQEFSRRLKAAFPHATNGYR